MGGLKKAPPPQKKTSSGGSRGGLLDAIQGHSGVGGLRNYQHLLFPPMFALSIITLAFNFLGDGLRDALDPRMIGEK